MPRAVFFGCAIALTLGLASSATADALRGIDQDAVQRFEAGASDVSDAERRSMRRLASAALTLRTLMAADPAALRAALEEDERDVLDRLVDAEDAVASARWRYFFRGSITVVGGALSKRPRLGFYNPVADAWVIAATTRSTGGGTRLTGLTVATGDQVSGRARAGEAVRPAWVLRKDLAMPTSLAFATGANVTAFERAHPTGGAEKRRRSYRDERALVERRLDLLGVTIATFLEDRPYEAVAEKIQDAIAKGDGLALARMTERPDAPHHRALRRIKSLGAPVRGTFHLVGTFRHADGMLAAFSSPYSGKWLVFADLDTSSGAPVVTDVVAVDLAQLL